METACTQTAPLKWPAVVVGADSTWQGVLGINKLFDGERYVLSCPQLFTGRVCSIFVCLHAAEHMTTHERQTTITQLTATPPSIFTVPSFSSLL
jgi:hypothetical protein